MHITELQLIAQDCSHQQAFYTTLLDLPLLAETTDAFAVQAGTTRIQFQRAEQEKIQYHFAFTIPTNRMAQAKEWLQTRVPLLSAPDGQEEFDFKSWNAHSIYFYDADNNIVEFIAHHDLPNDRFGPFSGRDLLHVSEIGLVVDTVPRQVADFTSHLGLTPYRGSIGDQFAAMGDIYGLFIIVEKGRAWFPTQADAAVVLPTQVTMDGTQEQQYHIAPYPYTINILRDRPQELSALSTNS